MKSVRLLVAGDPHQVTGGYIYDARITQALENRGCRVETIGLAGRFPEPDAVANHAMAAALAACGRGDVVVIDGLAMGGLPDVIAPHAGRLTLVALVHHPLADEWGIDAALAERFRASEARALGFARHVIVTSRHTARHLIADYGLANDRVSAVEPGVDRREIAARPPNAISKLLCVATLVPRKGHAVLIEALAHVADLPWLCDFIGDAGRDPACAAAVRAAIATHGLERRIALRGTVSAAALDAAYRSADLFVLPSHYEGYGMAITEALSYGLTVITTTGGALADTLPLAAGIAIVPGDAAALARALRGVLGDPALQARLAAGARTAAAGLPRWGDSGRRFLAVLKRLDREVAHGG